MICVHCNTPVPDHSKFCLACGSLVSDPDVQAAATKSLDESDTAQMEKLLRADTEGEFEIGELIGRGGMAAVYLAGEIHLARKVAIKVLPPELTFGHGIERFKREAKVAAALDHPNIIPIYRIASGGKLFWYAMKYLQGHALDELLRTKGRFSLAETVDILRQVADALDYAHEHEVIHRDVKPANVMVDERGRVVVTDFGIAKPLAQGTLTASGSVVGTPYYMSPEQGAGRPVHGASDQYSLAVMAYEMLSGVRPFDGDSAIDIVHKHVMVEPRPLEEVCPGLPRHSYAAVHRALRKKPEQRFPTVSTFVEGLAAPWVSADSEDTLTELPEAAPSPDHAAAAQAGGDTPRPPPRRKRPPLAGTLVVFLVALLAGTAWWWWWRLDAKPSQQDLDAIAAAEAPAAPGAADSVTSGEPTSGPTEPAGAEGAPPTGETPATAARQPPDSVTTRPSPTPARPAASPARLTVSGLPDSGSVAIDDGGPRPATTVTLTPGRHVVTLAAPGFETVVDTVQVAAGETLRIRYSGRPEPAAAPRSGAPADTASAATPETPPVPTGPPAILVVRIRGGWANIYVDDVFKRRAQFTLPDTLPAGPHTIRLQRLGFIPVDTTITLEPGQRRMITIPLRRQR
jgi:serine/threonine protein kinase